MIPNDERYAQILTVTESFLDYLSMAFGDAETIERVTGNPYSLESEFEIFLDLAERGSLAVDEVDPDLLAYLWKDPQPVLGRVGA